MKSPHSLSLLLFWLCSCTRECLADSSPLQDLCPTAQEEKHVFINGLLCKNRTIVVASDFKTSELNHAGNTDNFFFSSVNVVTAADFPGLNTQGLSIARTDMEVNGIVLPHVHARASELFYVGHGIVIAGFIDTEGRLFQKILREGDVFVFPRGLLHFCLNAGYELATGYSVLNSQNPGVVSITDAMFGSDPFMLERLVKRMVCLSSTEMGGASNGTVFLGWNAVSG